MAKYVMVFGMQKLAISGESLLDCMGSYSGLYDSLENFDRSNSSVYYKISGVTENVDSVFICILNWMVST